jgi:hypothetical protein
MAILSSEPGRTTADILRDHLDAAGLSQRAAARALHVDDRTMRRYCCGDLDVPYLVLYAASKLPLIDRNAEVIRMLDSGKLSTADGSLTKEQFAKKNRVLFQTIEFLVGRAKRPEI